MSEPKWARVLRGLHEGHFATRIEKSRPFTLPMFPMDVLEEESGLSGEEIVEVIEYLENVGLVTNIEFASAKNGVPDEVNVALTQEGFQVAHERELRLRQHELVEAQNETTERMVDLQETQSDASGVLASFTVVLGAAALVQAFAAVAQTDWPANVLLGVVYIAILIGLWLSRDQWNMLDNS